MFENNKLLILSATAVSGAALALWIVKSQRSKPKGYLPTDFESFLKTPTENPSYENNKKSMKQYPPTSFEAFLNDPEILERTKNSTTADTKEQPPSQFAPPNSKPVTVLFGTEFGFSREIAEKLCTQLTDTGLYWPQLLDMAHFPGGLPLDECQALLVVCSTQGDGVPPTEARDFCTWLLGDTAPPSLSGKFFSVCALGDRSYAHFCRCGKTIFARLKALGAAILAPRADINKEDWKAIDSWIDSVIKGLETVPLKTVKELGGASAIDINASASALDPNAHSKSHPYYGRVVAIECLCTVKDASKDKNTMRIEIDLGESGLEYTPGDALGIWPSNDPASVDELLDELDADGDTLVRVPSWHYKDAAVKEGATTMSLRDALTRCYDLRSPKLELMNVLASKLRGAVNTIRTVSSPQLPGKESVKEKEGAANGNGIHATHHHRSPLAVNGALNHDDVCSKGCVVDASDKVQQLLSDNDTMVKYLEERHVIDILQDFRAAKVTVGELLSGLRQLAPRFYSISSSPLEHSTRVQATIAVVDYASLGKERIGVCSTQVGRRLQVGDAVPVYIYPNHEFRLPEDGSTPIIMVGPGTGIAPFRAFLKHRELSSETGKALGQAVLYFGCRRRDQDYLYGGLLEEYAAQGDITLFTAFSRELEKKVYVQDRLRESKGLVWDLVKNGAHFYVCGDGDRMAVDVEKELISLIAEGLLREGEQRDVEKAAKKYVEEMQASGRYQKDVWSTGV